MNPEPTAMLAATQRERRNRAWVRLWLYAIAAMVLAIAVVGGATRLTDSGLAITEWQPVHGVIPPLNEKQWQEEFSKYRQIPEFRQMNADMTLAGFQFIYWWEWTHRLLGRLVGAVFALPLGFFWLRGMLEPWFKPRLLALLALGGLQGAIGWWMVSSGLADRVDVSQYRLAIHLTLAAIIFCYAVWLARAMAPHTARPAPRRVVGFAAVFVLASLCQLFLGALVAGLDAGLAFNDWPTMDGAVIPDGLGILDPWWRNLFENIKTVQFDHRLGGYVVVLVALVQAGLAQSPGVDRPHRRRAAILVLLALCQAGVGVATLMLVVPLALALGHQLLAFLLLGFAVAHWRGTIGPVAAQTVIRIRI